MLETPTNRAEHVLALDVSADWEAWNKTARSLAPVLARDVLALTAKVERYERALTSIKESADEQGVPTLWNMASEALGLFDEEPLREAEEVR